MMNHCHAFRWTLCTLLLGSAALAPGCVHSPRPPHSSLISDHRLQKLSAPPSPASYRVSEVFHGYYGTCWRRWPHDWAPCVEPCLACGTGMADPLLGAEMVPPPMDGQSVLEVPEERPSAPPAPEPPANSVPQDLPPLFELPGQAPSAR